MCVACVCLVFLDTWPSKYSYLMSLLYLYLSFRGRSYRHCVRFPKLVHHERLTLQPWKLFVAESWREMGASSECWNWCILNVSKVDRSARQIKEHNRQRRRWIYNSIESFRKNNKTQTNKKIKHRQTRRRLNILKQTERKVNRTKKQPCRRVIKKQTKKIKQCTRQRGRSANSINDKTE